MKSIPLSRYTFDPAHDMGKETNKLPSKCQPDQTLPLRELLTRFSRGQSVPTFDPIFDEGEDLPDVSKMSPIELTELAHEVKQEISYQRDQVEKHKVAKTKAAKATKKPDDAIVIPPPPTVDTKK